MQDLNTIYKRSFCICILITMFTISCRQKIDVFEKNTSITGSDWNKNVKANGSFIITDTLSSYNIYIVLRHTDSYQYNNIWLNVGFKSPGDSMYFQKVNLTLGDDANGWEGSGMNDIWEVRKILNNRPRRFIKNGLYEFSIAHIMREEPLKGVMSAGMRIEKSSSSVNEN
ncbi:MAG: gliding motility lipoprotein GldH [Ferruginibacter sp.]